MKQNKLAKTEGEREIGKKGREKMIDFSSLLCLHHWSMPEIQNICECGWRDGGKEKYKEEDT